MKCVIFAAVVTVRAITLRRTCLRTLRKEMRSGSILAPAASSMMILVRQWWTTRCAHASWHARWGSAERRICCGPRWNACIWRYEDSASQAVILGGEPLDERGDLGADRQPSRAVRVGPALCDQATVPPQD